ncbi:MAG: hypothetical protein ACK2UO_02610 [Caldilineaceae bacterium]|jgi:hypothetical protein
MSAKKLVMWTAVLTTAMFGVGMAVGMAERNAEARAREFCYEFPVGSPYADAEIAARVSGDPRHRIIHADEISIAYIGLPPFSRHVCTLKGNSGRVVDARYAHLD